MTVRLWDIGSADSELDTSMYVYAFGLQKLEKTTPVRTNLICGVIITDVLHGSI